MCAVTGGSPAEFLSALPTSGQHHMRLALFSLVNVFVILLIGLNAFVQGNSLGGFVLQSVIALVLMQFVYVLWLVIIAMWPGDRSKAVTDAETRNRENKPGRGVGAKASDQTSGPVS